MPTDYVFRLPRWLRRIWWWFRPPLSYEEVVRGLEPVAYYKLDGEDQHANSQ